MISSYFPAFNSTDPVLNESNYCDYHLGIGDSSKYSKKPFNVPMMYRHNLNKRVNDLKQRYVIFKENYIDAWNWQGEAFTLSSNIRGSSHYAYRIYKRLQNIVEPANTLKKMFRFSIEHRDCLACAYEDISQRWRTVRQNWKYHKFPTIRDYVVVIEPHKDYFPHYHVLLWMDSDECYDVKRYKPFTPDQMSKMWDVWGANWYISPGKIRSPMAYIFKYITKGTSSLEFISLLSVLNRRQFYYSKGFIPPYKSTNPDKNYLFFGTDNTINLKGYSDFGIHHKLVDTVCQYEKEDGWVRVAKMKEMELYAQR